MGNKNTMKFDYDDFLLLVKESKTQDLDTQKKNYQQYLQQFHCMVADHKNKSIEGICMNQICKQVNRRTCFDCIFNKTHDQDNRKFSLIINADQSEQIIKDFKIVLYKRMENLQIQFYFEQLEFYDEINQQQTNLKFRALEKIDFSINILESELEQINFLQYVSEQYRTNIGLFQYLQDYNEKIISVNNQIIQFKSIQFQVGDRYLFDIDAIRKKKIKIINSIIQTKYFQNENITNDQKEYLIKILEEINQSIQENEFTKDLITNIYKLLFQLYPINAVYYNKKGLTLHQKLKQEQAIIMYEKAINLDPNYAVYYRNKGDALNSLQKYEQAIVMYDQAIKLNPKEADYYNQIGNTFYLIKNYYQANQMYDNAIQINQKNADYYNNKGNILYWLQEFSNAIIIYELAIQLDPKKADYYNNKGNAFNAIKQYEEAIAIFAQAIQLNPRNADFYNNKGFALHEIKQYQQAIDMYDQAIKLNPKNADYYYRKGVALCEIEKFDQAINMLDQAIQIDPKKKYILNREITINRQKGI